MNRIVLDASIAIKWFFPEKDANKALLIEEKIQEKKIKAFVPQLFYFEVANVVKTKPDSRAQEVNLVIKTIFSLPLISPKIEALTLQKANTYAQRYDLTIYDANYIALAKSIDVYLVTADEGLKRKTKLPFIKLLKDYRD